MFQSRSLRTPPDFAGTFLLPEVYSYISYIRTHCQLENGRYIHVLTEPNIVLDADDHWRACGHCLIAHRGGSSGDQLWNWDSGFDEFLISISKISLAWCRGYGILRRTGCFVGKRVAEWTRWRVWRFLLASNVFLNQFLGQEVFAFHSCCTYPQAHKFYYIQDLVLWVFQTECDSVKVAIVGVLRSFDWDNTFQSLVSCKVASCFNSFENMPPWEIWRSVLEKRL